MCHELNQVTADPESSILDDLVKEADRLVSCLANMVIFFSLAHVIKNIHTPVLVCKLNFGRCPRPSVLALPEHLQGHVNMF